MNSKIKTYTQQLCSLNKFTCFLNQLKAAQQVRHIRSVTLIKPLAHANYFRTMTSERIVRR